MPGLILSAPVNIHTQTGNNNHRSHAEHYFYCGRNALICPGNIGIYTGLCLLCTIIIITTLWNNFCTFSMISSITGIRNRLSTVCIMIADIIGTFWMAAVFLSWQIIGCLHAVHWGHIHRHPYTLWRIINFHPGMSSVSGHICHITIWSTVCFEIIRPDDIPCHISGRNTRHSKHHHPCRCKMRAITFSLSAKEILNHITAIRYRFKIIFLIGAGFP